ncbi:unnamed protein product [Orchesella dallaii]|uniref:FAM21/CAPZIP domain-containing protein n=1 Tax=Orchesella dallaii TaxID=48710 RepID=A0ABP1QVP1_9HEXA
MSSLVAYDGSGSSSEDEDEPMRDEAAGFNQNDQKKKGQLVNCNEASSSAPLTLKSSSLLPKSLSSAGSSTTKKSTVIFSKFLDDSDEEAIAIADDESEVGIQQSLRGSVKDEANPIWSKFLPQPKNLSIEVNDDDQDIEIGPIPPKKTYGDEELPPPKQSTISSLTATKVKGKVRISIPFLNSLDDGDSEDGADKKRLMQPTKKGSGLFALLPKPKNFMSDVSNMFTSKNVTSSKTQVLQTTTDSTNQVTLQTLPSQNEATPGMNKLIPDSVKNKLKRSAAARTEDVRAKFSKRSASESVSNANKRDSDGSDDEGTGDFFSLDSNETADPEALEKLKLPTPDFTKQQQNHRTPEAMDVEESNKEEYYQEGVPTSSRSDDLVGY